MGVWIRSQDCKILTQAKEIWFDKASRYVDGHCIKGNDFILGAYPTEEQAKAVLDGIQEFINLVEFFKASPESFTDRERCWYNSPFIPPLVYQMPPAKEETP